MRTYNGSLKEVNDGVYNGKWFASGETWTMVNPANGEGIAKVRAGTEDDYDKCIEEMNKAKKEVIIVYPKRVIF
jgi:aldehyde dehydrogenase family 7 protein A1